MGHVFSLQAIATCEQQGHEFAWVQAWHDVGFDECRRCGLTRPGDVYDWSGCRTAPSEQPIDFAHERLADKLAPWSGTPGAVVVMEGVSVALVFVAAFGVVVGGGLLARRLAVRSVARRQERPR